MKYNRPPIRNYNKIQKNNSSTNPPPKANQVKNNNNNNSTNNNTNNTSSNIHSPFSSTKPQSNQFSQQPPQMKNQSPFQNNNNQFSPSNNLGNEENKSEQKPETKENETPNEEISHTTRKPKTSQKHKTNAKDYSINPHNIPRPNQFDEIFKNSEKSPIYETVTGTPPPHSTSFYSVKETQNSSCRFIRATLNSVPLSQSLLNETNLQFGICVQPFAEIPDYEEEIPKVETGAEIFRCKQCKCYINSKYNITYSAQNNQVAVCNLCKYENIFDSTQKGVKSEYFNSDFSGCPELVHPTIDFVAPSIFKSSKLFVPHYLFMIDISEYSYKINLPNYVINSIQTNLDLFHNMENSYIAFALYESKNIYFFYIEKEEVRLTVMGDLNDPFCPISMKKLYLNINEQREQIYKLIEKLTSFIEEKNAKFANSNNKVQSSTITGSAIKAGVDSLMENGGRLMIFTPNPCKHGYGGCDSREKFDKNNDPQKANLFFPQHEKFVEIGQNAANNKIAVDQFIFMSTTFDISTFAVVSNLSGGQIEYYNYSSDPSTISAMFEKLHYDLTRIVTRPNYYDCKFMLRFCFGLDCVEILGPFNKKLGEAFQLGGCDPDYCYYYNLRLNEHFMNGQKLDIQIVVLYDDNFSNRYVRVFNTSLEATSEVSKIYSNCEVDSLAKAMIYRETSLIYKTDFDSVRKNLEEKIVNSFYYYRVKEKKGKQNNQLILPVSIRYLPLYIDSFLKTGILSNKNRPENMNHIIYIMNKLLREPIYSTMKYLYPKFYKIDDIENPQFNLNNTVKIEDIGLTNEKYNIIQKPLLLRLSKDVIDFDSAYLIDNGAYIFLFIFDQIEGNFYNDVFNVADFDEAKKSEITSLNEENNSDLNQRLINIIGQLRKENGGYFQPVRIFFFREGGILNNNLTDLLKEDKINEYDNYPSYLCYIHNQIQNKILGN